MDIIKLSGELKESIGSWLNQMDQGLEPGRFRFCKKGSLVPASGRQGQFATCFAMKTAWHVGLWTSWPDFQREACVRFIQSFQQPTGYFIDEKILSKIQWGSLIPALRSGQWRQWPKEIQDRALRAETRQSASTLLMVGADLSHSLPVLCTTPDEVRAYLRGLPWSHPWSAGSHASHLIFFLYTQSLFGENAAFNKKLIETAFEELDTLRDPKTGTWFNAPVSSWLKINGAMKILTAYQWCRRPLSYANELLDFTLAQLFEEHGCGFLNRLFVIYMARSHATNYRQERINEAAIKALGEMLQYRQRDGAFSFYKTEAQKRYYDAWVSLGGRQSDLHGTSLITLGCALCFNLLTDTTTFGWQPSMP